MSVFFIFPDVPIILKFLFCRSGFKGAAVPHEKSLQDLPFL